MQELDEAKPLRHAMHFDVSVAREHVTARLQAALVAGGRIVDKSHAPSHWTLADRAGNRVCICAWPDGATQNPSQRARRVYLNSVDTGAPSRIRSTTIVSVCGSGLVKLTFAGVVPAGSLEHGGAAVQPDQRVVHRFVLRLTAHQARPWREVLDAQDHARRLPARSRATRRASPGCSGYSGTSPQSSCRPARSSAARSCDRPGCHARRPRSSRAVARWPSRALARRRGRLCLRAGNRRKASKRRARCNTRRERDQAGLQSRRRPSAGL